jgi:hypothetical protein
MKKRFLSFPWYYVLFSFYPLLFLWAANISQMDAAVTIRSFIYTIIGSAALFGILLLIFRNKNKAGIVGLILIIGFFTYGRVYYGTRTSATFHFLNHHAILIPLYLVLMGLCVWGALRIKKKSNITNYLNIVTLALVVLQVAELSYAYIHSSVAGNKTVKTQSGLIQPANLKKMPDIYVIVLDAYMRSDALKQDLGYENSDFINQLKGMGFYVPTCSHPDYTFTYASISSLFNMRYIPEAYANDIWSQFNDTGFWSILKNNEVYSQLKGIGYKTVSFEEEYPMLQFNNSDVLIGATHPSINAAYLYPFEVMYKQTTALVILTALDPHDKIGKFFQSIFAKPNSKNSTTDFGLSGPNKDFVVSHIIDTKFILNHIKDVPPISGPKLTYIHLFIPHYPYVFEPDGQINTNPNYYSGDRGGATSDDYEDKGYVNQVQYIDKTIVPILQDVIKNSKNPPIIILMGDHGLVAPNRWTNLEAFYFPEGGDAKLYSTISPVNVFRVIFNQYFGASYPLLPDNTYTNDTNIVQDPFPSCKP